MSRPRLADVLANPERIPLTIGREAATELGLEALEHMEGTPTDDDVRAMVAYAARHDEAAPPRDALLAVLLNASGTLPPALAERAVAAISEANADGRAKPPFPVHSDLSPVPRRQALAERLFAERARRIRPRMHAFVAAVLAGATQPPVPSWFLDRNWVDFRDALVQRVRNEPVHREVIARWLAVQPPEVFDRLRTVDEALVDVATQAILHTPERAPLAPYCGDDRVAERVRSAVNYRGEPARARLSRYLARLTPGTEWYETIATIAAPPSPRTQRGA